MNWTEKYRPKRLGDIRGQGKFIMDAASWLTINEMPNLCLYGANGIGKTTAALILGNEFLGDSFSMNFKEINASQDRRLDTIRETITKFANTKPSNDVPFKILLLDEIDGMTKDSQRALKRTMERAHNVRFIITCNEYDKVDYALRSRCANYLFTPLNVKDMTDMLTNICEKENIHINQHELIKFCESLNGDMRRGINELQACAFSNTSISKKTHEFMNKNYEILNLLTKGNVYEANELLMKEILSGRSVKEICNNLHYCVLEMEIDRSTMFKCLASIGEMEWRSKTMTPKIVVSWFAAQFTKEKNR